MFLALFIVSFSQVQTIPSLVSTGVSPPGLKCLVFGMLPCWNDDGSGIDGISSELVVTDPQDEANLRESSGHRTADPQSPPWMRC